MKKKKKNTFNNIAFLLHTIPSSV